jgi:anhydro-N-acetylmuramic acid kinase
MLIDALVQHFTHGRQRYDKDATIAKSGRANRALIKRLLQDPYLKLKPPKSTGREYFGASYVKKLLTLGRQCNSKPSDLIHAVTEFTAASVFDALHRFVFPKHKINEIIISGGGAQNPLIMDALARFTLFGIDPREYYSLNFPKVFTLEMYEGNGSAATSRRPEMQVPEHNFLSFLPSTGFGIPTDAKEALAFAILAYETFHRRPSNLPSATGARGPAILGKISYAPPS